MLFRSSPQTDNSCVTFQVLHEEYYNVFGNSELHDEAVHDDGKIAYKFDFLWGGNMISEQVIKNPCKSESEYASYPHHLSVSTSISH